MDILGRLDDEEAVLLGRHFVYTKGGHGPAYINMRQIAHQAPLLAELAVDLGWALSAYKLDMVVGPETLGRTLAEFTARELGIDHAWCDMIEGDDGVKRAVFSPKLNFQRLFPGKRIGVVDDLLTTGSSIKAVVEAITELGGEVVVVAAVVRRSPDVKAENCGAPELLVLAEAEGFVMLTEEECQATGPCSRHEPIVRRPGHGWKYEETHPDYEGGFV